MFDRRRGSRQSVPRTRNFGTPKNPKINSPCHNSSQGRFLWKFLCGWIISDFMANKTTKKEHCGYQQILTYVRSFLEDDWHAKRVESIAGCTLGVMHSAALGVAAIGKGIAQACGTDTKHAIKQVDRFLSNQGVELGAFFDAWVNHLFAGRQEAVVALDWTDFDKDNQSTLALHLITSHGRATPLMWVTINKSELKGQRNAIEDRLLSDFHDIIDANSVKVTVLADRGFGDAGFYCLHAEFGFSHVIRFKGNIMVTNAEGETRKAHAWLSPSGRAVILRNVTVTDAQIPVGAVVCVKGKGMKEPWFLACGGSTAQGTAQQAVKLYGRRFTIEENFRDTKDIRFGMGLSSCRISKPERRDRILLLSAIAVSLLTLLGAAGENMGHDRYLKANTSKKRTHSLFTQGVFYYGAIPNMKEERLRELVIEFGRLLNEHTALTQLFGVL